MAATCGPRAGEAVKHAPTIIAFVLFALAVMMIVRGLAERLS